MCEICFTCFFPVLATLLPNQGFFFFVEKKDGSLHPCIDYRGLNSITLKNTYPLPLMSSAFERLQGALFFTKLDLRNAYHLVRMREGDEWMTAYDTLLIPPPCTLNILFFCSVFLTLLQSFRHSSMTCLEICSISSFMSTWMTYWFFSHSLQEHVQHIRQVFQRLLENGLYVKAAKCVSHAQSVPFLGYIVSAKGVCMDPDKVKAVVDWPIPNSRKALQRFLGFANFHQHFILNANSKF